ncbi:MAG: ATP synthase F1 subunit delta [Elusimicrobia bacterium]|nr:ATP synthase F1 subunit delta [Elusimicrobiota bacterium]
MQASDRVLARRYAEAFYLSAQEGGEQEKARVELMDAYKALTPRLGALKNPTLPAREKKALVLAAAPGLSTRTRGFLDLLIDKKRIGVLPAVVGDVGRIVDEKAGRVRAQVRSAAELSPAELQTLAQRLKRFIGKDVVVEAKVDPELLGGVVVRMGDLVLDGSIQGKLRDLAAKLVEE